MEIYSSLRPLCVVLVFSKLESIKGRLLNKITTNVTIKTNSWSVEIKLEKVNIGAAV